MMRTDPNTKHARSLCLSLAAASALLAACGPGGDPGPEVAGAANAMEQVAFTGGGVEPNLEMIAPQFLSSGPACPAAAVAAIDQKGIQRAAVLGPPIAAHQALAPQGGCVRQHAHGLVIWHPIHGAHEVHGAIRARWLARGWLALGYPLSDELVAVDGQGRHSEFQHGSIYWHPNSGAHEVHGAIRTRWLALGGVQSTLGYPLTDERTAADGQGRYNDFQYGSIYWHPQRGTHLLPKAIKDGWMKAGGVNGPQGYPRAEPVAGAAGAVYQRFDAHGFFSGPLPGAPATTQVCSTAFVPQYGWAGTSATAEETPYSGQINGIAHSALAWFVTHNDNGGCPKVWRFPVSYDFSSDPGGGCGNDRACWAKHFVTAKWLPELVNEGLPSGYDHLGDADWYERPLQWKTDPTTTALEQLYPFAGGRLFVPLEGGGKTPLVAALDDNLKLRGYALLKPQTHGGWVAVNPTDGLIYSSNDDPTTLFVYRPLFVNGNLSDLQLVAKRTITPSDYSGRWAQGGAFSPAGKLYLTYDRGGGKGWLDILDSDASFGGGAVPRVGRIGLAMNVYWGEIQGLTVTDRPSGAHGSIRGQVHVVYLDQDANDDDWFLMHLELLPHAKSACF